MTLSRTFSLLLLFTFGSFISHANGELVTLPGSHFDTAEGNSQAGGPFASGLSQWQLLYEANLFTTVGPVEISGFRIRAGAGGFGQTGQFDSDSFRIDLSSSSMLAATLGANFDANHGSDRLTVRNGSLSVTAPTGSGPNPFGSLIAFDAPFSYDSSSGKSLIIHLFQNGASTTGKIASDRDDSSLATGAATALLSGSGSDATYVGNQDGMILQLQFTAIPEPNAFVTFLIASLFLATRRRH